MSNWWVLRPVTDVPAATSNMPVKRWSKTVQRSFIWPQAWWLAIPPVPHIDTFKAFLEKRYGVKVVVGTHPIPKNYLDMHTHLGTWETQEWQQSIAPTLSDETTRATYD